MSDPLTDFVSSPFVHQGATHSVFRAGAGPCVVVLAEMPGITPSVAGFARKLVGKGFSVAMPHLFGTPGADVSPGLLVRVLAKVCVSKEITMLATNADSEVTGWLRALAASEHQRCGGPGVGVVGMCLTGGFGLGMLLEPAVIAPVLSQPSLPIHLGAKRRSELGVSNVTLSKIKQRMVAEDICVLGLRFTGDKLSPPERFARLRKELGDCFIGVEIDSSPGNPGGYKAKAHSVLTEDFVPDAMNQVVTFLTDRLGVNV
jgi:dienelactone hydrolase